MASMSRASSSSDLSFIHRDGSNDTPCHRRDRAAPGRSNPHRLMPPGVPSRFDRSATARHRPSGRPVPRTPFLQILPWRFPSPSRPMERPWRPAAWRSTVPWSRSGTRRPGGRRRILMRQSPPLAFAPWRSHPMAGRWPLGPMNRSPTTTPRGPSSGGSGPSRDSPTADGGSPDRIGGGSSWPHRRKGSSSGTWSRGVA